VYGWLWRTFPGGIVGKVLCSLVLAAAAVAVLFLFVFPRVERLLPFQDVNVDTSPQSAAWHNPPSL
jgi:uncharacterized membrane protein